MIPSKPKRENYLEGLLTDGYYFKDLSNYYKAIAERAMEALKVIACFNDESASMVLKNTGQYGFFDEPNSVKDARQALSEIQASEEE